MAITDITVNKLIMDFNDIRVNSFADISAIKDITVIAVPRQTWTLEPS